ncbi:MAG: hypothetical protein ACRDKG_13505 [Actinomycetota bacterium]
MRTLGRFGSAAVLAIAMVAAAALPAHAEKELVGEATAQAFTLRASADQGGASPLHFYFGSYADAFLSTPPSEADGQASWYNLGISETALFKPPEECTPEKNAERVREGLQFVAGWLLDQITSGELVDTLTSGNIPAPPAPTLPCGGGRFPGFAQSRYPATSSIGPSAQDDLLASGACRGNTTCIEAVRAATAGIVDGGSFMATATDAPSQSSDAIVVGLNVPNVLRIGLARSKASTVLGEDGRVTSIAAWSVSGLCLAPSTDGCALEIEQIRKTATIVRTADGTIVDRSAETVITGVRGAGQNQDVTAADLGPDAPGIDLSDIQGCAGCVIRLQPVTATQGCGDPASDLVADAGGLLLFARGDGQLTLPIPIAGNAAGGGIMLGGACASGRVSSVELGGSGGGDLGGLPGGGSVVTPPITGGPGGAPTVVGPLLSPPRVVQRPVVRYELRSAPAWRTAPYWASVLGALLLLTIFGYVYRASPLVAPIAAKVDRFARQFLRG